MIAALIGLLFPSSSGVAHMVDTPTAHLELVDVAHLGPSSAPAHWLPSAQPGHFPPSTPPARMT